MPRNDGTGPNGEGPVTGGGFGKCVTGAGRGQGGGGRGSGRGAGGGGICRRRAGSGGQGRRSAGGTTPERVKLEGEKSDLESELAVVRERLARLAADRKD